MNRLSSRKRITVALVGLLLLVVVGWFVQQRSGPGHAQPPRPGAAAAVPYDSPSAWRNLATGAPQAGPGWEARAGAASR